MSGRIVEIRGKRFSVPPGYCLVEWVGEKSPLEDDYIHLLMSTNHFTRDQKAVLRQMAAIVIRRSDGFTTRTFKQGNGYGEIPHLSRTSITWGPRTRVIPGHPGSYTQLVTLRDARLLQDTANGHEFVVYGDPEKGPPDPVDLIVLPNVDIRLVKTEQFKQFKDFRRAMREDIPGWLAR